MATAAKQPRTRYGPRRGRRASDEPTCPAELAAKYERLAWKVAIKFRRRVRPADFDDAVQVARLAVFKAARLWDRCGASFKSYAFRAALNELLRWSIVMHRRGLVWVGDSGARSGGPMPSLPREVSNVRAASGEVVYIFDLLAAPEPPPSPPEWSEGDWSEVLSRLNETQRAAVIGLYVRGLTERELAAELGVTRGAVNMARRAALRKLREWFPPNVETA